LALEVPTQRLYLNLLNKILIFFICIILFLSAYIYSYLNIKKFYEKEYLINITQGAGINKIVDLILTNENFLNKKIYSSYLKVFSKYYDTIKFGEFKIDKKLSLIKITDIISKPSNVYREFTIISGWHIYQLEKLIIEKFNVPYSIEYTNIIADTYMYQSHNNFQEIIELMKNTKDNFFNKYNDNELLNKYSIDEIMIIASLVEKEGKLDNDKRLISSVILNRLDKNLKLEVDATTIFSITKGKYKLDRSLTYKDLKIQDKYNTYFVKGLPPQPICYVSRKTIEIVLENYKSNYLFYFYDKNIQKHVFSKTYKEHKKFLEEYRNSE